MTSEINKKQQRGSANNGCPQATGVLTGFLFGKHDWSVRHHPWTQPYINMWDPCWVAGTPSGLALWLHREPSAQGIRWIGGTCVPKRQLLTWCSLKKTCSSNICHIVSRLTSSTWGYQQQYPPQASPNRVHQLIIRASLALLGDSFAVCFPGLVEFQLAAAWWKQIIRSVDSYAKLDFPSKIRIIPRFLGKSRGVQWVSNLDFPSNHQS